MKTRNDLVMMVMVSVEGKMQTIEELSTGVPMANGPMSKIVRMMIGIIVEKLVFICFCVIFIVVVHVVLLKNGVEVREGCVNMRICTCVDRKYVGTTIPR